MYGIDHEIVKHVKDCTYWLFFQLPILYTPELTSTGYTDFGCIAMWFKAVIEQIYFDIQSVDVCNIHNIILVIIKL